MHKSAPDHHDAELVLRLYELRREPVMRESRDSINAQFLPRSFDDVAAIAKADHPLNRAYRQVSTYWEMAYGLIKHGTLNPDLALESNGEWVATQTEAGKYVFGIFQARIEKQRGS